MPPVARTIRIRRAIGEPDREVDLYAADLIALKSINEGRKEIKHIERQYRRLQKRGLATFRFETDHAGFPKAIAVLTPDGEQALTQV